jgi:NDP-sugar pyrophosphorylase family protein
MLLAAGHGTRLGELTGRVPKPLLRIGGMPVLERNLLWLRDGGITEVVINLHHLGEQIEQHAGDGSRFGLRVHYSREPELLGTAGAIKLIEDFLAAAPFLVVYGDNLFDFDLERLFAASRRCPGIGTLALFSLDQHQHTGIAGGRVELDRTGRILRFVEGGRDPAAQKLVNAGCYVLQPPVLQQIPSGAPYDFGKDLFPRLLRERQVLCGHVIESTGKVLGIDTPEALARARALYEEGGVAG